MVLTIPLQLCKQITRNKTVHEIFCQNNHAHGNIPRLVLGKIAEFFSRLSIGWLSKQRWPLPSRMVWELCHVHISSFCNSLFVLLVHLPLQVNERDGLRPFRGIPGFITIRKRRGIRTARKGRDTCVNKLNIANTSHSVGGHSSTPIGSPFVKNVQRCTLNRSNK